MKVLLTRPAGRNHTMADALSKLGIDHIVTPLLDVSATPYVIENITQHLHAATFIFISTNAVTFAQSQLEQCQLAWPENANYFAVGQATFEALKALGIKPQQAPEECQQTEGLLTLAPLRQLKNQKVVIVRGVGGRETLAEQLLLRGAKVHYWETYQRGLPQLVSHTVCHDWQAFGIDTIVVTSGEILENLIEVVPKELFAWLRACHIIVPSIRVEAQAKACGMANITNASAANSQAILAALNLLPA